MRLESYPLEMTNGETMELNGETREAFRVGLDPGLVGSTNVPSPAVSVSGA